MAVTIISQPPAGTGEYISGSYPFVFELSTDKIGPTITQHAFYAILFVDGAIFGLKYTVATKEDGTGGKFDFSSLFKSLFELSEKVDSTSLDLPELAAPWRSDGPMHLPFGVTIAEQFYDNGVFTQIVEGTYSYEIVRGWTDRADNLGYITNYWQVYGLSEMVPYSGHTRMGYMQRTDDPNWPTIAAAGYMRIQVFGYNKTGGGFIMGTWSVDRSLDRYERVVYVPLFHSGSTDQPEFDRTEVTFSTGASASGPWTEHERLVFKRTANLCVDEEVVIMFQDRFFQWSFFSFPKKHRVTINTSAPTADLIDGRAKYNLEASDTLALNTDWMNETQNELVRDLIQTEQAFIVLSDGSLEKVTVVPNSITLRTSRNDNMIQYSMQFRRSLDNFIP